MTPHTDGSLDDKLAFTCKDGTEHLIGKNYDERRGIGNGPQICLHCKETLSSLVATQVRQGIIDQLRSLPDDDHTPIPVEYVHYLADYHAAKLAALQSEGADNE